MKNKKGFSLTELLAVVVLLGVIIAIAIPSYNKYIEKTKDKKYESYEYAMEDAAEMFIQQCLVKNECPNGQGYSDVLGQRLSLNVLKDNLNLNEEFEGCELENSYVKVSHNGIGNTDIENYDYKVCLKCGEEYNSQYCEPQQTPVVSPYDLDNQNYTVYTKNTEHEVKDTDFDISKYTFPTNCTGDKKGGIKCKITSSDFIDDKVTLHFDSKTEDGTDYKFELIYDGVGPEITNVSIEKESVWTQNKKVEITYKSEGAKATTIKMQGKEYSLTEPNGSISVPVYETGKYIIEIYDDLDNFTSREVAVNKITNTAPSIEVNIPNNWIERLDFKIIPGVSDVKLKKDEKIYMFIADTGTTVSSLNDLTSITPQESDNRYTITGLTGTKDIYIKVFENEAGISSSKDVETETISGQQYHKYTGIKFDNKEPEISVVVDNTKWTSARTVTFKYNDDNGIASIKWKRIGDSTEKTITPTSKNGEETVNILISDQYVACVKDVAGKGGSKVGDKGCVSFDIENVTQNKPTITLISDNTKFLQVHSFRVASGADRMDYEKIEEIYVADTGTIVSSLNDLTEFPLQQNVNDKNVYTTDKGLTGKKDIYIKVFKNEAGISSGQGDKTETIDGQQYHMFSNIMFDNTPPTCSITAKYEGNVVTSGKYPYLTLHGSVSDSPSGHDGTYSWDNGAGTSQAPKVSDKKNYTLTVYDKAGNRGTCSYNTTDKIDETAPTITFLYNGSTTAPTAWRNTNVTLTAKLQSKNSANLLYYNYNNTGKKTINNTSYTTGTLATFSTTGSHSGSLKTAIKGLNKEIVVEKTSASIKIDKVVPTVNSITIPSFVGNKNNSKREVLQSGNTYTIKYHDPNETRWDWNLNTELSDNYEPVTLSLGIGTSDSGGSGISGNFIQYNRTSEYISKAEFDNRIQTVVNNMPSGEDNIRTIYIKVRDTAGNLSDEITIRFFRKTNNITGW